MSWLSSLFHRQTGGEALTLLRLRTARFRQLLRGYGALLALIEDAAGKQGGGFIFDKQYVIALAEQVAELSDAVVFDLNVLTRHGQLAFYEAAERMRAELRAIVAQEPDTTPAIPVEEGEARGPEAVPTANPAELAAALARSQAIYRESGQVACRGVAVGPVCNLGDGLQHVEPEAVPPGSVLVAADFPPDRGAPEPARRAAAILLDRGGVAGPAARLARELRIPAIVGLADATSRLVSGTEVTVDADENVVYMGRVPALLDYYRAAHLGDEEEYEYRLLRSVRRAAFPLTFAPGDSGPTLEACRTVHDLADLAVSLGGDALRGLLGAEQGRAIALGSLAGAPWCQVRVTSLEEGRAPAPSASVLASEIASRPLRALLEGLASHHLPGGRAPALPPCAVDAVATDEHVLAAMALPHGYDMVDATAAGAKEANSLYCRFAPQGEVDTRGVRGEIAAGVLARLGFAVAATGREVSGWIRGLTYAEIEERTRIAGRLYTRLAELGVAGWGGTEVGPNVDAFMADFA